MQGGRGVNVTFWGVRGSTPCSGPQYARYGGNTSCVSVEAEGQAPVIFDMGTGLRAYGRRLCADGADRSFRATVLLSHLHWDHVQGLPFFGPVAHVGGTLDVHGPPQPDAPLGVVFDQLMRQPFFPVRADELAGMVNFHDTEPDDFAIGNAKIRSRWIRHTSPTMGFRVDLAGVSIAYVSDHGPGISDDPDDFVPEDVLELADSADLLIHDSQHTCAEFEQKRHFGHSTVDYAVRVARESGVHRLALFHHCPSHGDDMIDANLAHAEDLAHAGIDEIIAAADGLTIGITHPVHR